MLVIIFSSIFITYSTQLSHFCEFITFASFRVVFINAVVSKGQKVFLVFAVDEVATV